MTALTVEQIYAQQIRSRSRTERLRLVKLVIDELAKEELSENHTELTNDDSPENHRGKHSVLEFAGIGVGDPIGIDAQEYVNMLRAEWDHRP